MTLNPAFALDYLVWDNTASVRYEISRRVSSPADAVARFDGQTPAPAYQPSRSRLLYIGTAKRRNLTRKEMATSGGAYTSLDQVWLIPDAMFPSNMPSKPGDVVVESDGTRWTVLENGWGKNRQTRRLTCRDLVLSYDLTQTIVIERPGISYDSAGVPVKAFPSDPVNPGGVVLYPSLAAAVQLITREQAEERGIRGTMNAYEVIVGQEVDVTIEDRILWGGLYLDIVKYHDPQRIDEAPKITAQRRV